LKSYCYLLVVLEYLRNEDPYCRKFSHIANISGVLAGRGINYCSNNYAKRINRWHITDNYIRLSEGSDCADAGQKLRPCGNYDDKLIPTIYCSESDWSSIYKSYENLERYINGISELEDDQHTRQYVSNVEFDSKDIPNRTLTKRTDYRQRKEGDREITVSVKVRLPKELPADFVIRVNEAKRLNAPPPQEEDNIIYNVHKYRLDGEYLDIYNQIVSSFEWSRGCWITRKEVVDTLIGSNQNRANPLRGRLSEICSDSRKNTRVMDENIKGLLFKKENGQWYLRYNK